MYFPKHYRYCIVDLQMILWIRMITKELLKGEIIVWLALDETKRYKMIMKSLFIENFKCLNGERQKKPHEQATLFETTHTVA